MYVNRLKRGKTRATRRAVLGERLARISHNNKEMENKTKALSQNFRRNMDLRITSRDLHPVDVERAFQFVPYWGITRLPDGGKKKGKDKIRSNS